MQRLQAKSFHNRNLHHSYILTNHLGLCRFFLLIPRRIGSSIANWGRDTTLSYVAIMYYYDCGHLLSFSIIVKYMPFHKVVVSNIKLAIL